MNGGFGYKYPPIVQVQDDSGVGAGAVVKVKVGETDEETIYYSDKEDFEHYEICDTGLPKDEFGRRWGPDGKDIGESCSPHEEHECHHDSEKQGSAEIRLTDHQKNHQPRDHDAGEETKLKRLDFPPFLSQEIGEENDQRELGELRRLKR